MEKVLFINACLREEQSRTLKLARRFLEVYQKRHPDAEVVELDLGKMRIEPLYPDTLARQEALLDAGKTDDPIFDLSHQFTGADKLILAAPFWESSFPAVLRIYLERVSGVGLTFYYDEDGVSHGLCKAKKMLFLTTRGGDFTAPEVQWLEMGANQLRAICHSFDIPEFQCISADGLDIITNDPEKIMDEALKRCEALAEEF